jgi:hypothetical protein
MVGFGSAVLYLSVHGEIEMEHIHKEYQYFFGRTERVAMLGGPRGLSLKPRTKCVCIHNPEILILYQQ